MQQYIKKSELAEKVAAIKIYMMLGRQTGKIILHEALKKYRGAVLEAIAETPAADVVKVRRGRWNTQSSSHETWKVYLHTCTACEYNYKTVVCNGYNYCPNCGAKMNK